ncbi:YqzL family protein [Paenibacillus cymbidii]|uniref:YqzL family protein n=1 Tax=Paenibacillus cymbidii TaxID=1639034 RepID=UPI00107FD7C1|nr:YqzL family protein [Paenibacillus cymbidii]
MRDFSWNYFSMTGDVDAYMLFKQMETKPMQAEYEDDYWDEDEAEETYGSALN